MASPSKTQIEAWTDRLAAILKLDKAGFDAELTAASANSLWAQVDLSADPAVENAMGTSSVAIDEMSLPANYSVALSSLFSRSPFRDWFSALRNLVTSIAGGSNATLTAYLTSISATLHPLVAEALRLQFGEAILGQGVVFCPEYGTRYPDKFYSGTDGTLTDDTTDATDVGTADIGLFAANGDAIYIGSRYPFAALVVALSTRANVTITPTIKYWNGSAWTAVSGLADYSVGFTRNDLITYTLPTDWVRSFLDASSVALSEHTPLYYLRISRGAVTVGTPPVGTTVRVQPAAVLSGSAHYGVPQPALGFVRITATDTVAWVAGVTPQVSRFKAPAIRYRALTPLATLTPTISYVDQSGAAAETKAQAAWTTPAAMDEVAISLNSPDTGVNSLPLTGHAATVTASDGVYEVCVIESRTPAL